MSFAQYIEHSRRFLNESYVGGPLNWSNWTTYPWTLGEGHNHPIFWVRWTNRHIDRVKAFRLPRPFCVFRLHFVLHRMSHGRDFVSIRLINPAIVSPFATHAASFAAAAGVSITAICFPPASARALRLRAWRSVLVTD